jgi:hypothetical protein
MAPEPREKAVYTKTAAQRDTRYFTHFMVFIYGGAGPFLEPPEGDFPLTTGKTLGYDIKPEGELKKLQRFSVPADNEWYMGNAGAGHGE